MTKINSLDETRLATEVTALKSHMKRVHSIRHDAAVLFSDEGDTV
jgi:hypothetical protein